MGQDYMYKFVCPSANYCWTRNVLIRDYVMLGGAWYTTSSGTTRVPEMG